jgi:hypothetical protein
MSVLSRQSRPPKAPVRMQPAKRARHAPLQLGSKAAGQLTVTHWKKASLQVFATVQMPGPACAHASPQAAKTGKTTARTMQTRWRNGATP